MAATPSSKETNAPHPTPAMIAAPSALASVTAGRTNGWPRISAQVCTQRSDWLPPPATRYSPIAIPVGGRLSMFSFKE